MADPGSRRATPERPSLRHRPGPQHSDFDRFCFERWDAQVLELNGRPVGRRASRTLDVGDAEGVPGPHGPELFDAFASLLWLRPLQLPAHSITAQVPNALILTVFASNAGMLRFSNSMDAPLVDAPADPATFAMPRGIAAPTTGVPSVSTPA